MIQPCNPNPFERKHCSLNRDQPGDSAAKQTLSSLPRTPTPQERLLLRRRNRRVREAGRSFSQTARERRARAMARGDLRRRPYLQLRVCASHSSVPCHQGMVLHHRRLDRPKTRLHGLERAADTPSGRSASSAHTDGATPSSPTATQESYIASWSMPGSRSRTNSAPPSPAMSLPGGRYNRHVLTACQQAGYTQIFTSIPRAEPESSGADHRPAERPRRHVTGVDRQTSSNPATIFSTAWSGNTR